MSSAAGLCSLVGLLLSVFIETKEPVVHCAVLVYKLGPEKTGSIMNCSMSGQMSAKVMCYKCGVSTDVNAACLNATGRSKRGCADI